MARTPAYVERVPSTGIVGILLTVAALTGGAALAQAWIGPLGSDPAPTWFYAGFSVLFAGLAATFRRVDVRLDRHGVEVAYGILRRRLAWRDVDAVERDDRPAFYGYGVRFGRSRGRWVWVFNVIGAPRVAVLTRRPGPASLVFSTRRPDEVLAVARQYLAQRTRRT